MHAECSRLGCSEKLFSGGGSRFSHSLTRKGHGRPRDGGSRGGRDPILGSRDEGNLCKEENRKRPAKRLLGRGRNAKGKDREGRG